MFKKLKDKLAEEVKSSPQRIQQFAQAAQAAVTSASSSISDITNNDLFSIGDSDTQKSNATKPHQSNANQKDAFQDISLTAQNISMATATDTSDYRSMSDVTDIPRQRRLSNSSFASDVSFKLPSYESPSMYHLQSDMDVSASEAEERGFASPGSGSISLDRVTKEQLYAAYRRTQERYGKYRTQYADLARHYKLLERENAKAKSVLVETQDKALRRISELREQCSLEQSAKAHLERALRIEIEERNIKIDTLTTKIHLLQSSTESNNLDNESSNEKQVKKIIDNSAHLIDLSGDNNDSEISSESSEVTTLNNKLEKMELLVNKYKESLKTIKEKNSQLTTELQVLSNNVEIITKENEQLKVSAVHLTEAQQMIRELKENNEELQNKINTYDFSKTKEISTLEIDLQKAQNEVIRLQSQINVFTKREEDNAISLAENKLSIHKELEDKEAEIKSLKDKLSACSTELQTLSNTLNDYKTNIEMLEAENSKINKEYNDIEHFKNKIFEKDLEIQELNQKCVGYEQSIANNVEKYKCLELQVTQETAEKLAIIDRNIYLENKNKLISEENLKKTTQLNHIENEMHKLNQKSCINEDETNKTLEEVDSWKDKCKSLELEIQEERVELGKLQSEIEKLLSNYELVQAENSTLNSLVLKLKSENKDLQNNYNNATNLVKKNCEELKQKISELRRILLIVSVEMKPLKGFNIEMSDFANELNKLLKKLKYDTEIETITTNYNKLKENYGNLEKSRNDIKEQYKTVSNEIILLKDEKHKLQMKINEIEAEKNNNLLSSEKELQNICKQYDIKLEELNTLKADKELLKLKLEENENKLSATMNNLKESNEQLQLIHTEIKQLKIEKDTLVEKVQLHDNSERASTSEINSLRIDLQAKNKDSAEQKTRNENLEQNYKELLDENNTLKNNIESIITNFKILENELLEVRKSHTEIVHEKDRLNSVIAKFETENSEHCNWKEQLHSAIEDNNILKTKCQQIKQEKEEMFESLMGLEQKYSEYEKVIEEKHKYLDECSTLRNELSNLTNKYDNLNKEFEDLQDANSDLVRRISKQEVFIKTSESSETLTIKNESDILKDENRRLLSDIEGLQSYLSKISKENSILNDKLREVIASSENLELNENLANTLNIETLTKNIQHEKDKCDDLQRQNSLLLEENLELKDQLQSEKYIQPIESKSNNESELVVIKDKFNTLLQLKDELENKLANADLVNKSNNQLHENNEKLRSTNEKLERRLDEALVSLRHLHSLQENTELEYLRNILYEYLTGTGAHSETLAKVLAAVVKFDDKQTQFILQKEKERQGLLRQLGLL